MLLDDPGRSDLPSGQEFPRPGSIRPIELPVISDPRGDLTFVEGMQALAEAKIGSQIHYPIAPHMQEAYSGLDHTHDEFPLARQLADEVFSLPMGPNAPEGTANAVGRVLGCLATADARRVQNCP